VDFGEADAAGERPLREAIASYLITARGARCTADQVLVMNGAQQALHLIAQVLLDPGEAAWIENPGYDGARIALEAVGARLVPVPVDNEGLDVAAGEQAARNARLAYVTPSHQFPLGVLMSASRRLQLLAWARRTNAWVIEDDYDSEFRYGSRPLPCLQGLDAEAAQGEASGRVLYVGTFSKTLVPGLRLGYLVVPDSLVDVFRAARSVTDRHTSTPDQGVLADFIGEGHYVRHIRQVRSLCGERQAALIAAGRSMLSGLLILAPDPAGLHLVGRLREGLDDRTAVGLAAEERLRVSPLSRYWIGERKNGPGLLFLGYAGFTAPQIRAGVEALRRALERGLCR
jgi:GntR family transcriptional regulator/MocR family aminotransferase